MKRFTPRPRPGFAESGAADHRPSLEIHVPISPTRPMFNMAQALTMSLRRYGGAYAAAPVILTVGEKEYNPILVDGGPPWLKRNNVSLRFVTECVFEKHSWYGTAIDRFRADFEADVVMMLDADILIARPFEELVQETYSRDCLAGVIAHVCPFPSSDVWQQVFDHCRLERASLIHEHSGWGFMDTAEARRFCPPYFNFGVICMPRETAVRVGERILPMMEKLDALMDSHFRCQIALTLAITELSLRYRCLPMRYNFPNDPLLEERHESELAHAAFLHILRHHQQIDKWQLFQSLDTITGALQRSNLSGINVEAMKVLAGIFPDMVRDQEDLDARLFTSSHSTG